MANEIAKELAALRRMTPAQLREKYVEVFGKPTVTKNRTWLIRRIAWRLQALAEGDLPQRAKQRAAGRRTRRSITSAEGCVGSATDSCLDPCCCRGANQPRSASGEKMRIPCRAGTGFVRLAGEGAGSL
jgi:hypothetical protein